MDSARARGGPARDRERLGAQGEGATGEPIVSFSNTNSSMAPSRRQSENRGPVIRRSAVVDICASLMKGFDEFNYKATGIDPKQLSTAERGQFKWIQSESPPCVELFELLWAARRQLVQCGNAGEAAELAEVPQAERAPWWSTGYLDMEEDSPARSVPGLGPTRLGRTMTRNLTVGDLNGRSLHMRVPSKVTTPPDPALRPPQPALQNSSSHRPSMSLAPRTLQRNGSSIYSATGYATPDVKTLRGTAVMTPDGFRAICQFEIISELGRGNFGSVSLAADQTGQFYAIKTLHKGTRLAVLSRASTSQSVSVASSLSDMSGVDAIDREIAVMKLLNHPNVVKLFAVIEDPEEMQTHLVMQYIENGPPAKLRADCTCKSLSVGVALHYMRQVAKGLEYLHRQGVIHRDIKPENILIGRNNTAFVADFGVSSVISEQNRRAQRVGTMAFFSPELLASADAVNRYGKESDVWAFGVTLFALVFGRLPFLKQTGPALVRAIMMDAVEIPEYLPITGGLASSKRKSVAPTGPLHEVVPNVPPPPELISILRGLLEKDPLERMTLHDFRCHPFVLQFRDSSEPSRHVTHPPFDAALAASVGPPNDTGKPLPNIEQRRRKTHFAQPADTGTLVLEPSDGLGADVEQFSDSSEFAASASPRAEPVGPTQEDVQSAVVQCSVLFRRRPTSVSVTAANAVSRFASKLRQATSRQRRSPESASLSNTGGEGDWG